ncbi:tetratricopeptide repeat protein [Paraburkholderia phosphatilytica]|uniref:tetratricopeptide repeat protein n=1 Tax=Paraburkholderia phosphatilytica TaxID=2282883 RepID=UPI001F0CAEBE|nr:tetratricopeptide repeat protein [Paraburkholderia phosphatilytica]
MMHTFFNHLAGRAGSTVSRLGTIAAAAAMTMALGACTLSRVTEVQPLPPNKTPTTASEAHIAEMALQSGNIQLATNVYQHIVQTNPNSVEGLTGLGNTLYTVGDYTRAGVYYEHASAADPKALPPLIGSARVAIHQRRIDDAIGLYRRVLTMSPDNAMAQAGLGSALDMKGDHAGAQDVLRAALKAHPGDPLLSIDLGLSLTLGGNPRDGANVLLDVTRYPEAPPQARQDLALAYGLLGNDDAAATILSQDLPKKSVQDNLRFYEIQRARLSGQPASVPGAQSATDGALATRSLASARADLPVVNAVDMPTQVQGPLTAR